MAESVTLQISGLDNLKRIFDKMPIQFQQNSIKKAANFAITPSVKAVEAEAPEQFGALKEAIGKRVILYRRGGVVQAMVGVKYNFVRYYSGIKQRPAKYLHLVMYGTAHSPPNRFMNRVFSRTNVEMQRRFIRKLKRDIPLDAARLRNKGVIRV